MTSPNPKLVEAGCRAICRQQKTCECAPICLSHLSTRNTDGQCPEAVLVWGRQVTAALVAVQPLIEAATLERAAQVAQFADWAISAAWKGYGLDGGEIQDKALALGLIEQVPYDPEIHGGHDTEPEPGDPWFIRTEEFASLIPATQTPEEKP